MNIKDYVRASEAITDGIERYNDSLGCRCLTDDLDCCHTFDSLTDTEQSQLLDDILKETFADEVSLTQILAVQIPWSRKTFGEGNRQIGVIRHIESELQEIQSATDPEDVLIEWIDVALLAFDGAWRAGFTAEQVAEAFEKKAAINRRRSWGAITEDQPIRHTTEG